VTQLPTLWHLIQASVHEDINIKLTKEIDQQEIKEALDQLHPDKAPGPERLYSQILSA
jgi:hypothetical protein